MVLTVEKEQLDNPGPDSGTLPRSVRYVAPHMLLDGEWRFDLDPKDTGLAQGWFLEHDYTRAFQWPSSLETKLPYEECRSKLVAWYERDFEIPAGWLDHPETCILLTLGACGYETRVWLNGTLLFSTDGDQVHLGEFNSFSYALPSPLLAKVNRLTVRTEDTLDPEIPRGKQESTVYRRGGIWYQTISGPTRSAWIKPVRCNRLLPRLLVSPADASGSVDITLATRIEIAGDFSVFLSAFERDRGAAPRRLVATTEASLSLSAGNHEHTLRLTVPEPRFWSPASPHLYELRIRLVREGETVSEVHTLFGLRSFEARGQSLLLNGKSIYLDGILYQPGTSTFEQMCAHMRSIKKLGCNMARIHIAGVDPRIYDLADELGLLLWVEVPSPHMSSERSRGLHRAELKRLIETTGHHPSVVIISLYNEDWGVEDISSSVETRRYIAETYAFLRSHYPQWLVVDNDGWRHVSTAGHLASDLLTAHIYTGTTQWWQTNLDWLAQGNNNNHLLVEDFDIPLVVGDPYAYRRELPAAVSEWGGYGWYGGPTDLTGKIEMIRAFKRELRKREIACDVYTQATSIETETNGLIDPETGELLVPAGLLASEPE